MKNQAVSSTNHPSSLPKSDTLASRGADKEALESVILPASRAGTAFKVALEQFGIIDRDGDQRISREELKVGEHNTQSNSNLRSSAAALQVGLGQIELQVQDGVGISRADLEIAISKVKLPPTFVGDDDRLHYEKVQNPQQLGQFSLVGEAYQKKAEALEQSLASVYKQSALPDLKNIETLDITGRELNPSDLKCLREATNLKSITFADSHFSHNCSDAEIDLLLSRLEQIHVVNTDSVRINDQICRRLQGCDNLSNLKSLTLQNCVQGIPTDFLHTANNLNTLKVESKGVTDSSIEFIPGLRQLRALSLSNTQVSDVGLEQLSGLENLQTLNLKGTRVNGSGLSNLAGLPIRSIDLSETALYDANLHHLSGFKSLEKVNLHNFEGPKFPHIGSEGTKCILKIPNLREITVNGASVDTSALVGPNLKVFDVEIK